MCSLQISVLFVFMRMEISLFNSGIVGSCGVFLYAILLRIGYEFVCVAYFAKWYVLFVPVCLPVVSV